jgi:hypothetical protein
VIIQYQVPKPTAVSRGSSSARQDGTASRRDGEGVGLTQQRLCFVLGHSQRVPALHQNERYR